jgi:hypothetical protein
LQGKEVKCPKSVKSNGTSVKVLHKASKEWDAWANTFKWETFEKQVMAGRGVTLNPIATVFKEVQTVANYHITINIQHLGA